MAIYHYKNSALIDRVEMKKARHGLLQATIIPAEKADAAQLEKLREDLGTESFSTLMDSSGERATIQVRGLKDEKSLLAALGKHGYAKGGIKKEATPEDNQKQSFSDRVRGSAVFLSALFYDLGNAAFFASGIQRGKHNKDGKFTANDKSEMMIGAAFSVGDVLMTFYGKDKGDEELHAVANGLKRHLHQKGIRLGQGDALNPDTLHQSGAMKATDRWLRKHIIHTKCLSEFAGGLFTIHAALKPGNRNNGKLAAGFLISTGWLATLLLDKPHHQRLLDGDDPPANLAETLADNPRGLIARPLAIGNNIANLYGSLNPATGERARFAREVADAQRQFNLHGTPEARAHLTYTQNKQHDYVWNVISACSFMVAHVLFGLSGSKRPKETEDDKSLLQDIVLLSANVLARQPEAVREASIGETADYVSKLAHIGLGKQQVEEAIRDKIASLSQSTWASRVQQNTPAGPTAGPPTMLA